jgi:predicted DNA binding CopG/RHH family protein
MEQTILVKTFLSPILHRALKAIAASKGLKVQTYVAEVLAREPEIARFHQRLEREKH